MIQNSKGTRYFGLHFYPGVAEYAEPDKKPYRVFLNENTLRDMDKTFEGRPVFVMHVDGVEEDIDELRKEADGWVLRSFYNAADGKHWVEFILVTEKAEQAVKRGWQLSNSYFPKAFADGGLWNGVKYDKEITAGEYEHLALVPNPRYEESVIMTPEEFKAYNDDLQIRLDRLANEKEQGMLKIFKRTKVDNAVDLESMVVVLPKSGKEVTITQLVNDADAAASHKGPMEAHPDHMVDMGDGKKMSVKDMHAAYKQMCDELEAYKKNTEEKESEVEEEKEGVDVEGDDKAKDNDDEDADEGKDKDDGKESKMKAEEEDKEVEAAKKKNELESARQKKEKVKEKADRLRNAGPRNEEEETARVEFSGDQVARGKARYGSN